MGSVYDKISATVLNGKKSFCWLIDPDKCTLPVLKKRLQIARESLVDYIFLGGSLLVHNGIDDIISIIKSESNIPVILFPGNTMQVSPYADAILFLSLISGRNPDYLIGRHVEIAPILKSSGIEVIPTGYMLIDSGLTTTVSYISNTLPIPYHKTDIAVSTAIAGELLGQKLLYLEAGSGASNTVNSSMILKVKQNTNIPLITGGGIRTKEQLTLTCSSGADLVVVGNAIEENDRLIGEFSDVIHNFN